MAASLTPNLGRLLAAMKGVLGEQLGEEIRALTEGRSWYLPELPGEEVVRLWVLDCLDSGEDPQWIFQPLRAGERRFLCDQLDIEREGIVGLGPQGLADRILGAVGIPSAALRGPQTESTVWDHLVNQVDDGDDERASLAARQCGERLLRKLLHFYVSLDGTSSFVEVLRNPGSMRLPGPLKAVVDEGNRSASIVSRLFLRDGWADLGFLTIAAAKFAARLERNGVRNVDGRCLQLMSATDQSAFEDLSRSLQAYTHDRPSKHEVRADELRESCVRVADAVNRMRDRGVIPDRLWVVEKNETILGTGFRGRRTSGGTITLLSDNPPHLGATILYVASTNRDYASCRWVEDPWTDSLAHAG